MGCGMDLIACSKGVCLPCAYLDGEQALGYELRLATLEAGVLTLQELQHLQLAGVVAPLGQAAVELPGRKGFALETQNMPKKKGNSEGRAIRRSDAWHRSVKHPAIHCRLPTHRVYFALQQAALPLQCVHAVLVADQEGVPCGGQHPPALAAVHLDLGRWMEGGNKVHIGSQE